MRKSLVGFSHTVRIFFLLESTTFALGRCYDFVSQLVGNGFTVGIEQIFERLGGGAW